MNDYKTYQSPLSLRYASKEMQYIFSDEKKYITWRKCWIALAQAEQELGLDISDEQISELIEHMEDINFDIANEREKIVKHDVMAHVYAYGKQCPKAKGIIHLGATSCYVKDNTDLIIMHEGLELLKNKLVNVLFHLKKFRGIAFATTMCIGNMRNATEFLANYHITKDKDLKYKSTYYYSAILIFSIGAILGFVCSKFLSLKSIWISIIPLFLSLILLTLKENDKTLDNNLNKNVKDIEKNIINDVKEEFSYIKKMIQKK